VTGRAGIAPASGLLDIAARNEDVSMNQTVQAPRGRRVNWTNVTTVLSAAILISAEVFGAAFAGGWALAGLFGLGQYGVWVLQVIFFLAGMAVMVSFIRAAQRVEPFVGG
jgi:hypothetical protein